MKKPTIHDGSKSASIPDGEFDERVEKTRQVMAHEGIDLLLFFSTESEPSGVRYYSDYWPSFETAAVLIPINAKPLLLIGPESRTFSASRSKIGRVVQMKDFRESSQPDYPGVRLPTWADIFGEFPARRLGVAGWHMFPQAIMANLLAAAGSCAVSNADHVVRRISMKKSASELCCLREAARISETGYGARTRAAIMPVAITSGNSRV